MRAAAPARAALLAGLAAVLVSGCVLRQPEGPVPPQPPVLEVELTDHDFAFEGPAPAGRLVVEATNVGEHPHELVMLALPDDFDGDVENLVGTGTVVLPVYSQDRLEPGETGRFAVDLERDTYALACFVEDENGESHHEKGQVAELAVR